jgi:polyhydroxyalkanoate synthesis repressor PhaR
MASDPVVIKKYPNRRLYDTSASRYINLEDIATFVREGRDLQVVDAQTGEDLTRVTLTQIIMEDAKQQQTGLPLELLRQLIVSSDRMGREFIMWYLKSAYDAYQSVQSKLHTGLSDVQSAALSPLNMVKNFIHTQTAPNQPGQAQQAQPQPDSDAELRQLRERLAGLEARMQAAPPKAQRATPAKRKAASKKRAAKPRR